LTKKDRKAIEVLIEADALMEIKKQRLARKSHLEFMQYAWIKGDKDPLIVGFHTKKICLRIDRAMEDFRKGISTYLLISVHPRAGKSEIVSRYLGPHFLGEFPDKEVMQVTYQATLAASFSSFGRNVVRSKKFRDLYPDVELSSETNQKANWTIADKKDNPTGGKLYAAGLQSGLTGNGFHLGILDDYFAGRAEAESKIQRDNAWDAFANDFMTRAAPVAIVVVLATQWHIDDINGRIKKESAINENFPQFEVMSFPARAADYTGEGEYTGEYLFTERYPESWYRTQYATLGPYSASSLFDCNPMLRTGGRFKLDGIDYYDHKADKNWIRVWDLAHTAKARAGDDPDWTSGTKLAIEVLPGDPVPHLWIDNVFRARDGAAVRDEKIKAIAMADSAYVRQGVEVSQDSKDACEYLRKSMPDISWNAINLAGKGDKGTRATPLEPIFAAYGHVHVRRADWNNDWISELMVFDGLGNAHDDQVDNMSAGYIYLMGGSSSIMTDEQRAAMASRRR
jgi:predicted phage terminase large subunit-like protein